jgi:hypothetical protein
MRQEEHHFSLLSNVEVFMRGRRRRRLGCRLSDHVIVAGIGMLTLADFGRSVGLTVTLAPVVALAVATVLLAITYVLHLAVTVGAPGPVTITARVVVALATVVLARRQGVTLAARRRATATGRALTGTTTLASLAALRALTTGAVAARVESPGCGRRGACPLHLIC